MNLCIPVTADRGPDSPVSGHFGSAPLFLIVDTDDGACRVLDNRHSHHEHGRCRPLEALQGEAVDAVIVGGIGMGALTRLWQSGVEVYRTPHPTVGAALAAFGAGTLQPMTPEDACAHHGGQHAGEGRPG